MNYKDKDWLKNLFDIGDIEFETFRTLPINLKPKYLERFKKEITLDDFDNFCTYYNCDYMESHELKKLKNDLLSLFNITCEIPYYLIKDEFIKIRERNIQYTRNLKIKLLWQ